MALARLFIFHTHTVVWVGVIVNGTGRRTDKQADTRTNGRMDEWTDRQYVCVSECRSGRSVCLVCLVCLSVCVSVRLSVCLSVCLSVGLTVCLSVCVSVYLPVSVCLFVKESNRRTDTRLTRRYRKRKENRCIRYVARSCGRSSPDSLAFLSLRNAQTLKPTTALAEVFSPIANTRYSFLTVEWTGAHPHSETDHFQRTGSHSSAD